MDRRMRKLTPEDLAGVSGGTTKELAAFTLYTQAKYGTTNYYKLFEYYTPEEMTYGNALFFHVPGDPYPPCPDPGFNLEEWLEKVE